MKLCAPMTYSYRDGRVRNECRLLAGDRRRTEVPLVTWSAFSPALARLGAFLRYTVALPTFSLLHLLSLLVQFPLYQLLSQFLQRLIQRGAWQFLQLEGFAGRGAAEDSEWGG